MLELKSSRLFRETVSCLELLRQVKHQRTEVTSGERKETCTGIMSTNGTFYVLFVGFRQDNDLHPTALVRFHESTEGYELRKPMGVLNYVSHRLRNKECL